MNKNVVYSVVDWPSPGLYYQHRKDLGREQFCNLSLRGKVEPKVVYLGDAKVGKTTLIGCMQTNKFHEAYKITIGAAYETVICRIAGQEGKLICWDTAGQEKGNALTKQYYRGADMVCLCFALDDPNSFARIEFWRNMLIENIGGQTTIFLVGCKSDLDHKVKASDIQKLCEKYEMEYFETSAKAIVNVSDLIKRMFFLSAASQSTRAVKKIQMKEPAREVVLTKETGAKKKKSCCK